MYGGLGALGAELVHALKNVGHGARDDAGVFRGSVHL